MTSDDIKRICFEVRRLSHAAHWDMKGLPVIVWQFATIGDFASARRDLLMAMTADVAPAGSERERLVSGEVTELECYGVIFRLVCAQQSMTRSGPLGANETPVIFRDHPR